MADFSSLLADPGFQFGLSLLGNAHSLDPFAKAQSSMMQFQKQQAEQQLMASQQQRMSQQTLNEKQQQAIGLVNLMNQLKMMGNINNLKQLGGPGVPQSQIPPPQLPQILQDIMQNQGMNGGNTTGLTQQALQPPPTGAPQINLGNSSPLPDTGGSELSPGGSPVAQSVQPPDVTQTALPQPPAVPTGKFGTPLSVLNGVMMNESSGNPQAVNPKPLPNGKHAVGLYGWNPDTVDMLHKQGIPLNPVGPAQQQHDAADFYLNQLVTKYGGWDDPVAVQKGLNDFQGAFKTVGSPANLKYNANATKGLYGSTTTTQGTPPPSLAAPTQATPPQAQDNGTPLIQVGGMAAALNPAMSEALTKAGTALQPKNVPAGDTQYFPATGATTQAPMTPLQKLQVTNSTVDPKTGMTPLGKQEQLKSNMTSFDKSLDTSYTLIRNLPQDIDSLNAAKAALPAASKFMGPTSEGKLAIAKFLNQTFPGIINMSPEAVTNADVFKSQVADPLLHDIKATGGRFGPTEQALMERAFGSLDTDPTAAGKIIDIVRDAKMNILNRHNADAGAYNAMSGDLPHRDYTLKLNPPPAAAAAAKPTLQQWIPAAMKANPGASQQQVIAEYNKRYGQ